MQMVLLLLFTETTLKNSCKQTETNHLHASVGRFRKSYARCNTSKSAVAFGHKLTPGCSCRLCNATCISILIDS